MLRSKPERGAADSSYDPRTRGWYRDAKAQNRSILTNVYADAVTRQLVTNMHSMISRLQEVSRGLNLQAETTAEQAHERSQRITVQQDEINLVATAINEMAAATQEIANNAAQSLV